MEEILVNEEGYLQFLEELESAKNSFSDNARVGGEVLKDAVGDGWHDNFAYDEVMRKEREIVSKIKNLLEVKKHLKVVKVNKCGDNIVNVDDTVELLLRYALDDEEVEVIKLTGKYIPNSDVGEISLNSPLGKAIYKKKIGSKVSYVVNEKKIEVEILRKV